MDDATQLQLLLNSAFRLVTYAIEMLREAGVDTHELERLYAENEEALYTQEFEKRKHS